MFIFNGRMGRYYGTGKYKTTNDTTIYYFLGSAEVMQCVPAFKVLDFEQLLPDVHCGLHARLTLMGALLT